MSEKMSLRERLGRERLYFDGGTGTVLQGMGLLPGQAPEIWNTEHPERITALHKAYLDAGADLIKANTFGVNSLKYADTGTLVREAMACARKAIAECGREGCYVALDLGPTGKLLKPLGDLEFEEAVAIYADLVKTGVKYGADLVLIETMGDAYETKAAVLAAKENSDLPVFVTNAYDATGHLLTGATPTAMVAMLEGLGVDALGVNCSVGPKALLPIVEELTREASVPVIVNPNAGLPVVREGKTEYDVDAASFAETMKEMVGLGACVLGGCCGTTPEYITALKKATAGLPFVAPEKKSATWISSGTHGVKIGDAPILIGERINPTGKKKIQTALRSNDLSYILNEGVRQAEAGVQVLDVNAGLPDIDEKAVLEKLVRELQSVTDLPLQIDTADPAALERAMRSYCGKPLVNSVNGKAESMDAVFPLLKKYGGAVIALTIDEKGIPDNAKGRVAIARKILKKAVSYGIDPKNIIVDPLVLAVSSDPKSAAVTLASVEQIKQKLGLSVSLGVSNISFGLPERDALNATFFALALERGLDAAIMNPFSEAMMRTYHAFLALREKDENCAGYIRFALREEGQKETVPATSAGATLSLHDAVLKGLSTEAAEAAGRELATREPLDLVDRDVIPALNEIGAAFEKGQAFLPQLLTCAGAATAAFEVIRQAMPVNAEKEGKYVVLATVKGDIHDIGKNIVKTLLENYGFDVIDLGRDVPPATVVDAAVKSGCRLVGLSALMTTTVPAMEETVRLLHESVPGVRVVVGGAVLTQEYADRIGADFYGRDAMATVRIAQEVYGIK